MNEKAGIRPFGTWSSSGFKRDNLDSFCTRMAAMALRGRGTKATKKLRKKDYKRYKWMSLREEESERVGGRRERGGERMGTEEERVSCQIV